MKQKRFWKSFFIPLVIMISGCSNSLEIDVPIHIRKVSESNTLSLSNIKVIRFSNNPFSPISSIEKIINEDDRFYILDKRIGNSVFVYDTLGYYINHIFRVGEGPGEYKNVDNIFFNNHLNHIILMPMDARKEIHFDKDGNFIYEEFYNQNFRLADLATTSFGNILINQSHINGGDNLQIWRNNSQIASFFPFDDELDVASLNQRNLLSKVDSSTFNFSLGFRDSIYSIDLITNEISYDYIFDFGNEISFRKFSNLANPLQYFMDEDFLAGIIDIFQNDNFLTFSTLDNSGIQGRIVSKRTRRIFSANELIEQEIGNLRFEGILGVTNDQRFIAVIGKKFSSEWDFSKLPVLESQVKELGELESEELILLVFNLNEN